MTATFPPSIIQAAQSAQAATGTLASVTLAQWAVESAWGTRMSGRNNPFGIKATSAYPGSMVWTHEYVNGVRQQEECSFADFDSLADGFTAHGELLAQAPAYAAARACLPDALAFVAAMGPVYATSPDYVKVLDEIIQGHELTQYDDVTAFQRAADVS